MSRLVGRAWLGLAVAAVAVTLLAPTAAASPIGDAEAAMMAAWDKAGGGTSTLGARRGDVYPVGDGFALDFDGGRMYFTPATGAKFMFGPILDKYESLGGPVGSDLGFPTINEVPGLAGPDSRVSTFAASDNPVIFWTPDHGAFVVRGALNAAWDKLGSSGGVLGAPTGDETYDKEVTTQKFTGGEVSWNRKTKEFTTNPPALAEPLKGLQVAVDPTAAINMAWRSSGGAGGPLGPKKGDQYPIGGDGIAQDFNGGKIFFSPATGANAVEGPILQKYESLGGPVGSELGFPIANEADGGITPASRIAMFSAADKPVIFWTPDHGAFVVRGAMKAAWDKLKGPTGKLGAPIADQTVDGDVVSQKFTGGKISWNRAKNTFSTDPANLASLLTGLQVSGQNQPSNTTASPPPSKGFTWHWWWLVAAVPVLLLILMSVLVVLGLRRRRAGRDGAPAYEPDLGPELGSDFAPGPDEHWRSDELDFGSERFPPAESEELPESDPASSGRVSWPRGGGGTEGVGEDVPGGAPYGDEQQPAVPDEDFAAGQEDPDRVDTTPIPPFADSVIPEPDVPETVTSDAFATEDLAPEIADPDAAVPAIPNPRSPESDTAFPDIYYPAGDAAASEVTRSGRHAAFDQHTDDVAADTQVTTEIPYDAAPEAVRRPSPPSAPSVPGAVARPTLRLPLDDPYQVPDGYPIKANANFGLYYTPSSALYHDTLAEVWFASEEAAQANGFVKAD